METTGSSTIFTFPEEITFTLILYLVFEDISDILFSICGMDEKDIEMSSVGKSLVESIASNYPHLAAEM